MKLAAGSTAILAPGCVARRTDVHAHGMYTRSHAHLVVKVLRRLLEGGEDAHTPESCRLVL